MVHSGDLDTAQRKVDSSSGMASKPERIDLHVARAAESGCVFSVCLPHSAGEATLSNYPPIQHRYQMELAGPRHAVRPRPALGAIAPDPSHGNSLPDAFGSHG